MTTLTAAAPDDLEEVQQLLASHSLPSEDIAFHFEHFIVARAEGVLIGVAGLERHGGAALLRSLCVVERARGRGLGPALCDEVETRAAALGVRDLYLLTTTARRFFAKRGFAIIDREQAPSAIRQTAEFRLLCPDTAVCMHKELPSRTWVAPPSLTESAGSSPAPA